MVIMEGRGGERERERERKKRGERERGRRGERKGRRGEKGKILTHSRIRIKFSSSTIFFLFTVSTIRHEGAARDRDSAGQETADQSGHTAGEDDPQNRRHSITGRMRWNWTLCIDCPSVPLYI